MVVALGKGETDEYKDNLHKVGETLRLVLNHVCIHVIYCKDVTFSIAF